MTDVVLFHHALGLTPGVLAFADDLRAAGHHVFTPDLYEGRTFEDLDTGVAHAEALGMPLILDRAHAAAVPADAVYAGFSLGAMAAQALTQTRPGARGALLYHGAASPKWFPQPWPSDVALQVHTTRDDPWVDRDERDELLAAAPRSELFLYPGAAHLFADPGAGEYDAGAAGLLRERTLEFLDRVA